MSNEPNPNYKIWWVGKDKYGPAYIYAAEALEESVKSGFLWVSGPYTREEAKELLTETNETE
jgi:hypothetical protein